MEPEKLKRCSRCEQSLPMASFHNLKSTKDGKQYTCMKCLKDTRKIWRAANMDRERDQVRRWRKDNPEKFKVAYKKWASNNPLKLLFKQARNRAKAKGIEFTLLFSDVVVPDICPVLRIPLYHGKTASHNSPSLDRFDNDRGYIRENTRVISLRANRLKSDAKVEELEAVVRYMRNEC